MMFRSKAPLFGSGGGPTFFSFLSSGTSSTVISESLGAIYQEHVGGGNNHALSWFKQLEMPVDTDRLLDLKFWTRRDGDADSLVLDMKRSDGSNDASLVAQSVLAASNQTWEIKTLTPGSIYTAGDRCVIRISSIVDNGERNQIRGFRATLSLKGSHRIIISPQLGIPGHSQSGSSGTTGTVWDPSLGRHYYRHLGTAAGQVANGYRYSISRKRRVLPVGFETYRTGSTTSATISAWVNGVNVINDQSVYPSATDTWEPWDFVVPDTDPEYELLWRFRTTVNNAGEIRLRDYVQRQVA